MVHRAQAVRVIHVDGSAGLFQRWGQGVLQIQGTIARELIGCQLAFEGGKVADQLHAVVFGQVVPHLDELLADARLQDDVFRLHGVGVVRAPGEDIRDRRGRVRFDCSVSIPGSPR